MPTVVRFRIRNLGGVQYCFVDFLMLKLVPEIVLLFCNTLKPETTSMSVNRFDKPKKKKCQQLLEYNTPTKKCTSLHVTCVCARNSFTYLINKITSDGKSTTDINCRMTQAKRKYFFKNKIKKKTILKNT